MITDVLAQVLGQLDEIEGHDDLAEALDKLMKSALRDLSEEGASEAEMTRARQFINGIMLSSETAKGTGSDGVLALACGALAGAVLTLWANKPLRARVAGSEKSVTVDVVNSDGSHEDIMETVSAVVGMSTAMTRTVLMVLGAIPDEEHEHDESCGHHGARQSHEMPPEEREVALRALSSGEGLSYAPGVREQMESQGLTEEEIIAALRKALTS